MSEPGLTSNDERFSRIIGWRNFERRKQGPWRFECDLDERYYDGLQLAEDELRELQRRRQAPTVYNEIKPAIDWLIGTERKTSMDWTILPKKKGGEGDAQTKTQLMKYLHDVNRVKADRSDAAEIAFKAGLAWREVGIRDDDEKEPIFTTTRTWREVWPDSNWRKADYSDGRYLFSKRRLDVDIAQGFFPKFAKQISNDANYNGGHDSGWYLGQDLENASNYNDGGVDRYSDQFGFNLADLRRKTVDIWECWYYEIDSEKSSIGATATFNRRKMRVRCMIFTEQTVLWDDWSPYEHNKIPYVPMVAYRRGHDGAWYGAIRQLRSIQDAVNKKMSKGVFSANAKTVLMETDAFDPKVMSAKRVHEEAMAPNGLVVLKSGGLAKIKIEDHSADAAQFVTMAGHDRNSIRDVVGVTGDNLGQETSATSGRAIIAKQQQGSQVTYKLFDNQITSFQVECELVLSLAEQYYTEEKWIRVTDERGHANFTGLNVRDEVTGQILNPITAMQAQFKASEQDYRASWKQAAAESLLETLRTVATFAPQMVVNLMDLVVEMMDIPNGTEWVKRIRDMTGQVDPDEQDPAKTEQAKIAKDQAAAKQAEYQDALAQAQLRREQALADEAEAKAQEAIARVKKLEADTILQGTAAAKTAMEAATAVAANPAIAPVADEVLRASGYVERNGPPVSTPVPAAPAPPAPGLPPEQPMPAPPAEQIPQ